ncbi:MAG: hypothetical protein AAGF67_15300 [Verrucomicrobiota bacterium]
MRSRVLFFFVGAAACAAVLAVTALILRPSVTQLNEGVTLVQFLNTTGASWVIESGESEATITELSRDSKSVVTVKSDTDPGAVAHVGPEHNPSKPFPATAEEMEQSGVYIWRVRIPDDVREDEHMALEWRIGDEQIESGLDFEGVPMGEVATVILWMGELYRFFNEGKQGEPPIGIPYSMRYTNEKGRDRTRHGILKVPRGWEGIYSVMQSGSYADGGWLMLLYNEEYDQKDRYFAFLDLYYRAVELE